MLYDRGLPEEFLVECLLPFFGGESEQCLYIAEWFPEDDEHFFPGIHEAEFLLCELVLKLLGAEVREVAVPLVDFRKEGAVPSIEFLEGVFEEDVPVEREREAEGHESHYRETGDHRELLPDVFRFYVWLGSWRMRGWHGAIAV